MKLPLIKLALAMISVVLLIVVWAPGGTRPALAIPPAALTPTAEPPTRTPTVQPSTSTPAPSATPTFVAPTGTAVPTREPEPGVADPAVTKSVNVGEARAGDIVDFTLTVTNHGDATADDVIVTDALPDFLDVIDSNTTKGTIATDGRTIVITIGQVAPGEVVIIHIRARVNERAQPPGGRNNVTLTTSSRGDDPNNDADAATISFPPSSSVASPTQAPGAIPSASPGTPGSPNSSASPGPAAQPPARMPRTAAAPAGFVWPLALLGLVALVLGLLIQPRGAEKPDRR